MPTIETSAETADFLNELSPYLSHLPPEEHVDLLEELAIHLESHLDVAEAAGDTRSLRRIIGSPEAFVTDYCVSAQIPLAPPTDPAGTQVVTDQTSTNTEDGPISQLLQAASRKVKSAEERILARDAWRSFVEFLPELAPAWWVARAFLFTMVLGGVIGGDGVARLGQIPIPKLFDSVVVGVGFSIWLASRSVAYGRRHQGSGRMQISNVAMAIGAFFLLGTVAFASADPYYNEGYSEPSPQAPSYVEPETVYLSDHGEFGPEVVDNLFVYDIDGQLLENVRIFDQAGRPFAVATTDGWDHGGDNIYPRVDPHQSDGLLISPPAAISPLPSEQLTQAAD